MADSYFPFKYKKQGPSHNNTLGQKSDKWALRDKKLVEDVVYDPKLKSEPVNTMITRKREAMQRTLDPKTGLYDDGVHWGRWKRQKLLSGFHVASSAALEGAVPMLVPMVKREHQMEDGPADPMADGRVIAQNDVLNNALGGNARMGDYRRPAKLEDTGPILMTNIEPMRHATTDSATQYINTMLSQETQTLMDVVHQATQHQPHTREQASQHEHGHGRFGVHRGVQFGPTTSDASIQHNNVGVSRGVQFAPNVSDASIQQGGGGLFMDDKGVQQGDPSLMRVDVGTRTDRVRTNHRSTSPFPLSRNERGTSPFKTKTRTVYTNTLREAKTSQGTSPFKQLRSEMGTSPFKTKTRTGGTQVDMNRLMARDSTTSPMKLSPTDGGSTSKAPVDPEVNRKQARNDRLDQVFRRFVANNGYVEGDREPTEEELIRYFKLNGVLEDYLEWSRDKYGDKGIRRIWVNKNLDPDAETTPTPRRQQIQKGAGRHDPLSELHNYQYYTAGIKANKDSEKRGMYNRRLQGLAFGVEADQGWKKKQLVKKRLEMGNQHEIDYGVEEKDEGPLQEHKEGGHEPPRRGGRGGRRGGGGGKGSRLQAQVNLDNVVQGQRPLRQTRRTSPSKGEAYNAALNEPGSPVYR